MAEITAAMVMSLRERTGAGMMECKKFLIAANGDIDLAITDMRKAGQAKADKKADRIAAEGLMSIARSSDGKHAVILEINSETDFASRDEHFINFAKKAVDTALHSKAQTVELLSQEEIPGEHQTVEQARQELVAKIGENIRLRRLEHLESKEGVVGSYLHGHRIGVLLSLNQADDALARDLAMHVAASRPSVVRKEEVTAEAIAQEREIFIAQARETGKAQEIIDKMIDGRISKFLDEVSLYGQSFVKDPNTKVGVLLKQKNAEVSRFIRFEVGEGIEKKEDNFAEEVMAQVRERS